MQKLFLAATVLLLVLAGCSKATKENYDKIKVGMPYEEVVKLIGKPEGCSEAFGISSCQWKNGEAVIDISFIADQVTITSAKGLR